MIINRSKTKIISLLRTFSLYIRWGISFHSFSELYERPINIIFAFCTCKHYLPWSKDENWFDCLEIFVNHSWEILVSHYIFSLGKSLYMNFEANISIGDHIGDFEWGHLSLEAHDFGNVFDSSSGSTFSLSFWLRANNNHPARFEAQDSAARRSFSHDHCWESFFVEPRTLDLFSEEFEV